MSNENYESAEEKTNIPQGADDEMPIQRLGKMISHANCWCWLAAISFLCGCFTFYKGIDKMVNYNNGEKYPYEIINAYVGGDAYNYIINGTYATAYFVLTSMFVLAAIGLTIIYYLSKTKP